MSKAIRRSPPLIILLDVLFIFIFILAAEKPISFEIDRLDGSKYNNYSQIIACSGRCSEADQKKWTSSGWTAVASGDWNPNSMVYLCNKPECEIPVSNQEFEKYYAMINSCLSQQIQYLFYNLCSSNKTHKYCRPLSIPVNLEGNIDFSIFEEKYKDIKKSQHYESYKHNIEEMC